MGRYIFRRIVQALPLIFLVSLFMFTLVHLLPGGPEAVLYNPRLPAGARMALRERFGLDDPIYIQYFKWLRNMLVGDFGFSFVTNQPVGRTIALYLPRTLELFCSGLLLALVVALALGLVSALRHHTLVDYALTVLAYFGVSMPIFLFGLFAQDIFGVRLRILPTSGTGTVGVLQEPFWSFMDHLWHLILPMTVLAIVFVASWSRYVRSSMIDVINQDYIRTARAKGVAPMRVMVQHALRNALIPFITVVALDFGSVAGGAAVTEGIFAWQGMGLLFIDSLSSRDYPILMAMLLLSAVFVIIFNLLADILYAIVDPRIRYA